MVNVLKFNKRRRDDILFTIALMLPAGLIMAVVTIYPLARSFLISLVKWDLTKPNQAHSFIGLENYAAILKDPTFWQSAKVTAMFTVGAVVINILIATIVALLLNREFRGRNIVRMLALLPWAIPGCC